MRRHLASPAAREKRRFASFCIMASVVALCLVLFYAGAFPHSPSGGLGLGVGRRLQSADAIARCEAITEDERRDLLVPDAFFTCEQRLQGAIAIELFIMCYMFAALAIVCDEYFVASLEKLTAALRLSEDVAGATFMEAGGSAPELATSLLGLFVFRSDVGVGTIVGSASFNVLFVIALCCFFGGKSQRQRDIENNLTPREDDGTVLDQANNQKILTVSPFPVYRDSGFYSICLALLTYILFDSKVEMWEAVAMLLLYLVYIVIMANDTRIKRWFYGEDLDAEMDNDVSTSQEVPPLERTGPPVERSNSFERNRSLFLIDKQTRGRSLPPGMVDKRPSSGNVPRGEHAESQDLDRAQSTTDGEGDSSRRVGDKDRPRSARQATRELIGRGKPRQDKPPPQDEEAGAVPQRTVPMPPVITTPAADPVAEEAPKPRLPPLASPRGGTPIRSFTALQNAQRMAAMSPRRSDVDEPRSSQLEESSELETDSSDWEVETDSLAWRIFVYATAPVGFLLWLTVPHCQDEGWEWAWPLTFGLSVVWITVFTYLMVWMAVEACWTFGVPQNLMGITVLAAGTSIPDALSSLAVARQGAGDMAFASAIGSNVFDFGIGLPLPWVLYLGLADQLGHGRTTVPINSPNLWMSVITLLGMMFMLVKAIQMWQWQLTWELGVPLFGLYFVFLVEALILDYLQF